MKFVKMVTPFDDMKMWGAKDGNFTFVVTFDYGEYRCSWKNIQIPSTANHFGGAVHSYNEAIKLCENKLKELRS